MVSASSNPLSPFTALIEEILPTLAPDPGPRGPGRPPILPLAALWGAILLTMLDGPPRQRGIWRHVNTGLLRYPAITVTDEAVRYRLRTMRPDTMAATFTQVTATVRARLTPEASPFPGGVFALDATTLDQVARPLVPGTPRPLAGRIHSLFDVTHQCFHAVVFTDQPHENEQVGAPSLLAQLPPQSLVLMDRGYVNYARYDALTDAGQAFITRLREAVTPVECHCFTDHAGVRDTLIWLGAYRADRCGHLYRLITIGTGEHRRRYLTNVTDPARLRPAAVARWYQRRWDIERAFKTLKQDLGLAWIWSRDRTVIAVQLWATLLLAQIASVVRQAIATAAAVPVEEVSLELLLREAPKLVRGVEGDLVAHLARTGRTWGLIRPVRRVGVAIPDALPWDPPPLALRRYRSPRYAHKP